MKKYLLSLVLLSTTYVQADPLMTLPDSRANGMGGAFTAIANNSSATYYNPAGLTSLTSNVNFFTFSVEGGDYLTADYNTPDILKKDTRAFLGLSLSSPEGGGALTYFSEHKRKNTSLKINQNGSSLVTKGDYTVDSLAMGFSKKIFRSTSNKFAFSAGISLGMFVIDLSNVNNYDTSSTNDKLNPWFSFGLMAKLYENRYFSLLSGVSTRQVGDLKYKAEYSDSEVDIPDLPDEYAGGIAINIYTTKGTLVLSYDYKLRKYQDANVKYTINAAGAEFGTKYLILRGGFYKSTSDKTSLETTGITGGLGLRVGNSIYINASYENRKIKNSFYEKNFALVSASFNIMFYEPFKFLKKK